MIRFYHKNRHRINGLRKHGSRDFEKPFDRRENNYENRKNHSESLVMSHTIINYDFSGTDWSLRPPLASAIYFAVALEYVMDQLWLEIQSVKHILINENQYLLSEITSLGNLNILTMSNIDGNLALNNAADSDDLDQGTHLIQAGENGCAHDVCRGKDGSCVTVAHIYFFPPPPFSMHVCSQTHLFPYVLDLNATKKFKSTSLLQIHWSSL